MTYKTDFNTLEKIESEKKEDGTYEMIDKKEISASVLAKAMK